MRQKKEVQLISKVDAGRFIDTLGELYMKFVDAGETSETNRAMASALKPLFDAYGIVPPRKCDGDAHDNAYIDHCYVCIPHWGKVYTDVKVK